MIEIIIIQINMGTSGGTGGITGPVSWGQDLTPPPVSNPAPE